MEEADLFDEFLRVGIVAAADEGGERYSSERGFRKGGSTQADLGASSSDVLSLQLELETLKRQQRALQLVTAARQLCGVLTARLQVLCGRWFHHWKGLLIARASKRRSHDHQISMKRELIALRRSLTLSNVIATVGLHAQGTLRNMVQHWGWHTRAAMRTLELGSKIDLKGKLGEAEERLLSAEAELDQTRRQVQDIGKELTLTQARYAEEMTQGSCLSDLNISKIDLHSVSGLQDLIDSLRAGCSSTPGASEREAIRRFQVELDTLDQALSDHARLKAELRAAENAVFVREEELEQLQRARGGAAGTAVALCRGFLAWRGA